MGRDEIHNIKPTAGRAVTRGCSPRKWPLEGSLAGGPAPSAQPQLWGADEHPTQVLGGCIRRPGGWLTDQSLSPRRVGWRASRHQACPSSAHLELPRARPAAIYQLAGPPTEGGAAGLGLSLVLDKSSPSCKPQFPPLQAGVGQEHSQRVARVM